MPDNDRILRAFALMYRLHGNQVRKCGDAPFVSHLLAVAALVAEYGGTEDQFIAALLHDAVEDQGGRGTLDEIRREFGTGVADLVWACSDACEDPKPTWRARKEAHLARIATMPVDARLILAADKLHNLQSMLRTCTPENDAGYWRPFNGGRDGTRWYYEAMGAALESGWEHPILRELREARARFLDLLSSNEA